MTPWLGVVRGADFFFTSLVIGSLVFYWGVLPAGGSEAPKFDPINYRRAFLLWGGALIFSIASFLGVAADMAECWAPAQLWSVLNETSFGRIAIAKLGCLLLLGFLIKMKRLKPALVLSLALPITLGLSGHAGARHDDLVRHLAIDYLHYLSVSVWSGGLLALRFWLADYIESPSLSHGVVAFNVVGRFSRFAIASTMALLASGVTLAYSYGVSFTAPWEEPYGILLLIKTGLFFVALGFASVNQFRHLRRWTANRDRAFAKDVRREVSRELAILMLVFVAAGFLTRTGFPGE